MAKDTPTDPAERFRELVTQWERGFDSFANQLMGTEGFSKTMNRAQDARLGMRQAFSEFMGEQLNTFNMPTRDDIIRLAEAVHALDKRMASVETLLEAAYPEASKPASRARKGPPRTKRPPSLAAKGVAGGRRTRAKTTGAKTTGAKTTGAETTQVKEES